MIHLFSATQHHHSKARLEEWFKEEVDVLPLYGLRRRPIDRDYINDVTAGIIDGVGKIHTSSRVHFLITGHPIFNIVAYEALRQKLSNPFIVMVYKISDDSYELFSSEAITMWGRMVLDPLHGVAPE